MKVYLTEGLKVEMSASQMEEMMEMQKVSTMVCNLVVLKGDSWVVVKANRMVANLVGTMVVLTVPLKVDGMVSLSAPQWVTLMDFAKVDLMAEQLVKWVGMTVAMMAFVTGEWKGPSLALKSDKVRVVGTALSTVDR